MFITMICKENNCTSVSFLCYNKIMNIDVVKEKINWYKLLFTILITAAIGSIGWLTSNLDTPWRGLIITDILSILFLSFGISVVVYKIRFYLKKLGEF